MTIKITDSDVTREDLLNIQDFNEITKEKIKSSDILIVPNLCFRSNKDRLFYAGTSDFLKLARQELHKYSINIGENDGSEKSLMLHSGEIWIPILLISIDPLKDILLPTVINLITNYIFYKFPKDANDDKSNIHVKILVENRRTKVTKTISYDGNLSGLKVLKLDSKKIFE